MGSSTISTTTASTVSTTSTTTTTSPSSCNQLLEITLISAQDLALISKSSKTFAVVWTHPDRKLSTSVKSFHNSNPTWNDKFVFRVSDEFMDSEESAVFIEIYTVSWFRNNVIGTVRVMINDLIPPSSRTEEEFATRFVALQVRRPSGSPEGILNMAVSLTDCTDLCDGHNDLVSEKVIKNPHQETQDNNNDDDDDKKRLSAKIHSWQSDGGQMELNCEDSQEKGNGSVYNGGSVCNGSMVNGSSVVTNESDVYSDVGPSASVVAAAIAQGMHTQRTAAAKERPMISKGDQGEGDTGSSILGNMTMEEAKAKGYRLKAERSRTELPSQPPPTRVPSECWERKRPRRRSDSLSCFVYGLEFTIVCGASNRDDDDDDYRYSDMRAGGKPISRSLSEKI